MHCQQKLCRLHLWASCDSPDLLRLALAAANSFESSRWAIILPRTVRTSCARCSQGFDCCICCAFLQIDHPRSTEPRTKILLACMVLLLQDRPVLRVS